MIADHFHRSVQMACVKSVPGRFVAACFDKMGLIASLLYALRGALSATIVRVPSATVVAQRFGFLCKIMQRYFSGDYEGVGSPH